MAKTAPSAIAELFRKMFLRMLIPFFDAAAGWRRELLG